MMMANNKEERNMELIRVSEAAKVLGTHTMAIYRMIRDGRLDGYKVRGCVIKVDKNKVVDIIKASQI